MVVGRLRSLDWWTFFYGGSPVDNRGLGDKAGFFFISLGNKLFLLVMFFVGADIQLPTEAR
jgi:hypothetical protein